MATKRKLRKRTKMAGETSRPNGKEQGAKSGSAISSAQRPSIYAPYPYDQKLEEKPYLKLLTQLQIELLKVQRWCKTDGQKVAIVFEGRDAAGKGGTIGRFREHLNPRGARVVALEKPTDAERGQWYFQRYVAQLPTNGEIVFFDRSWYNRAGVEPVMGFCTPKDYQRFIHQVPHFEQSLIESGLHLFKLWFDVGRKEQRRRLLSRKTDPLKLWKVSPMDDASMARWDDYTKARDGMFLYTHTPLSPWTVIRSDDKNRARIGAILSVLNRLPYPEKDAQVVTAPDPLIVGSVDQMVPLEGRFMFADEKAE
jgi:polyphosphate kinase 2